MSSYEVLSICVALAAFAAAWIANVRSGRAVKAAERANEIAEEANRIVKSQAIEVEALNVPKLFFSSQVSVEKDFVSIDVAIFNSGNHLTRIREGKVLLHSNAYPNADIFEELAGKKIPGREKYVCKFRPKRLFIYASGTEISPTELYCKVIYSRPEDEDGKEEACFKYDRQNEKFV